MKKKLRKYNKTDSKFIENATKDFIISYPDEVDDILNHIKEIVTDPQSEQGNTPLKYILRKFEEEARKILKEYHYPQDMVSLCGVLQYGYCDDKNVSDNDIMPDIIVSNAIRVVTYCEHIRDDITNNESEQAAIDMMKLIFAAVAMNVHDELIRGIRQAAGSKSKKPPRSCKGILMAIEKTLRDGKGTGKRKPSTNLWRYFRNNYTENDRFEIDEYEIYFEKDNANLGGDRLVEIYAGDDNSKKSMAWGTFEKKVNAIRKNL